MGFVRVCFLVIGCPDLYIICMRTSATTIYTKKATTRPKTLQKKVPKFIYYIIKAPLKGIVYRFIFGGVVRLSFLPLFYIVNLYG